MSEIRNNIAFVDTETTGLDPMTGAEIVEVACLLVKPEPPFQILTSFEMIFLPSAEIPEEVTKINGHTRASLQAAGAEPISRKAIDPLDVMLENAILAGQNPSFDRKFLVSAHHSVGMPMPKMDYHTIDVASLAVPMWTMGLIPGLSLRHTRSVLGVAKDEQKHRAMADAMDALNVFRVMVQVYGAAMMEHLDRLSGNR